MTYDKRQLLRSRSWLTRGGSSSPADVGEGEGPEMALSDQLNGLAVKAKQVQDRVAAANRDKSRPRRRRRDASPLPRPKPTPCTPRPRPTRARSRPGGTRWNGHGTSTWLPCARASRTEKPATTPRPRSGREQADEDASYAIDYAYAAIEEAQYAVLDADLAHRHADGSPRPELRSRPPRVGSWAGLRVPPMPDRHDLLPIRLQSNGDAGAWRQVLSCLLATCYC